jgi:hypothetical protein
MMEDLMSIINDPRNALTFEEVVDLLLGERKYQVNRWNINTTSTEGRHPRPEEWLVYIQAYLTEAIQVMTRAKDPDATAECMEIIRKITTLGFAAMQQIGCKPR